MRTFSSIVAASLLSFGCIFGGAPAAEAFNGAAQPNDCSGLSADLGQEGFAVYQVSDLKRQRRIGKAVVMQPAGAQVFIRAEPGLSAPYLQRVVNCQVSGGQSTGPLGVPGVTATVVQQGEHFVVQILAPNMSSAKEVQQRAQTLTNR